MHLAIDSESFIHNDESVTARQRHFRNIFVLDINATVPHRKIIRLWVGTFQSQRMGVKEKATERSATRKCQTPWDSSLCNLSKVQLVNILLLWGLSDWIEGCHTPKNCSNKVGNDPSSDAKFINRLRMCIANEYHHLDNSFLTINYSRLCLIKF